MENNNSKTDSIIKSINVLNSSYDIFLSAQKGGLEFFDETIDSLISIFGDLVREDDDFFSFLNCKFMGKNIRVVLKFLEKCLGGNFNTVGVCLLLAGCSLDVAISFTIFLIVIINENVQKK